MSAANVQLSIDQGEDWVAQIIWTDASDDPIPVVAPCRMDVKDASGATILSISTTSTTPDGSIAPIELSEDIGMIQLYIDKATSASLPDGLFGYDLFVTVDDGGAYAGTQVNRLIAGTLQVNKRITSM